MGNEKLKGVLAGISLAGLMTGVVLTAPGNIHGSSGWGGSSGAVGAEEKAKSGWGGSSGTGGALKPGQAVKPAPVQKTISSAKKLPEPGKKTAPEVAPEAK